MSRKAFSTSSKAVLDTIFGSHDFLSLDFSPHPPHSDGFITMPEMKDAMTAMGVTVSPQLCDASQALEMR